MADVLKVKPPEKPKPAKKGGLGKGGSQSSFGAGNGI
jgi:hypothetical protein